MSITTYPCGCVYAGGSPFCLIHERHLALSNLREAAELLPCPYCGAKASKSVGRYGDGREWNYIQCDNCGAINEPEWWNKRATEVNQ